MRTQLNLLLFLDIVIYLSSYVLMSTMMMALKYLNVLMGIMVGVLMLFLTTVVCLVLSPIGLFILAMLLGLVSMLSLIKIVQVSHPPWHVALLFHQVREALGLLESVTKIGYTPTMFRPEIIPQMFTNNLKHRRL